MADGWAALVEGFQRFLEAETRRMLNERDDAAYRVFRLKETGTCIVLRDVGETSARACLYGPVAVAALSGAPKIAGDRRYSGPWSR